MEKHEGFKIFPSDKKPWKSIYVHFFMVLCADVVASSDDNLMNFRHFFKALLWKPWGDCKTWLGN